MKRSVVGATVAIGGLVLLASPLHAQGYYIRWDTRMQSVAYRGVVLDSIRADSAVADAGEGFTTPDGFAVRCVSGAAYCTYFAPGPEQRGAPLASTVDARLWGFGVSGLSLHVRGRATTDLQDPTVWPTTEPNLQLLEGYAEYATRLLTVQAGRTHHFSRLGFHGFDGVQTTVRPLGGRVQATAYGGWSLAEAAPVPVTSPDLNPLSDFRPAEREMVWGAAVGLALRGFEGRLLYQHEWNPELDQPVSKLGAVEAAVMPGGGFTVAAGFEYDFLADLFGTHDIQVKYRDPHEWVQLSVGEKRYRPIFPAWTIWGAFSPVGHTTRFGSLAIHPIAGLELRTRGEAYTYEESEAKVPIVTVEDEGWRWSVGGTYTGIRSFLFDANYHVESGPGASSLGFNGRVNYQALDKLTISAHGGRLIRPLEYRWDDAKVWSYGLRVDLQPLPYLFCNAEAVRYDETRERPDAAQFDWSQTRFNLGLTVVFGSGSSSRGLHPAILRVPETRRSR